MTLISILQTCILFVRPSESLMRAQVIYRYWMNHDRKASCSSLAALVRSLGRLRPRLKEASVQYGILLINQNGLGVFAKPR